jgi:hypothetical protein
LCLLSGNVFFLTALPDSIQCEKFSTICFCILQKNISRTLFAYMKTL